HLNLSTPLLHQGKFDEAIATCRKATELNPKLALAHHRLGSLLGNAGQVDRAIACFRKLVELDSKSAHAHAFLGLSLMDRGDVDEAAASFKKALALDPGNGMARHLLAEAGRLATAGEKFPAFREGKFRPTSTDERLALARWCKIKKLHRA